MGAHTCLHLHVPCYYAMRTDKKRKKNKGRQGKLFVILQKLSKVNREGGHFMTLLLILKYKVNLANVSGTLMSKDASCEENNSKDL